MDAACSTTHLKCTPKVEQTITWANPPDLTIGDPLGDASLKPTAQDPIALEFFDGSDNPITNKRYRPCPCRARDQVLRASGRAR